MASIEDQELFNASKRAFADFLDADYGQGIYKEKVRYLIDKKESRLVVNLNDLREFDRALAERLLRQPLDYLAPFNEALKEFVLSTSPSFLKDCPEVDLCVGFEGSFGRNHVSPRLLLSHLLGSLVCVEGIVTKCSLVRPKVVKSVHYCPTTKSFTTREYRDVTSIDGLPTSSVYPTRDSEGNPLETEFGLSQYKDHQSIAIQEMPERAPPGQLPRSIDVVLDGDLVDRCKPGDRVQLVGVYKALAGRSVGHTNGVFKTIIIANYVKTLSKEILQRTMTDVDIKNIRELAQHSNVMELLAASMAPSISGHAAVKQALLLLLVGGLEKNLANGTHLRGDINMLMVGDPSTAKSQLLRYILNIAPLAINTTGRGSTGVGLTAAVTTDKETGERRLEAGAMVLADRGVVCIDEFDKMSDADRVAIHEVMEQQTVTIAKAGVHASLNARCSVVAAANPQYGKYNKNKTVQQNIAMPDSLLSRFDLLFIILDEMDPERDRTIASHVLRMHRYRKPGDEGAPQVAAQVGTNDEDSDNEDQTAPMYEKYNPLLYGDRAQGSRQRPQILSMMFLKKFIQYAKSRCKPSMTDEAAEVIAQAYSDIRSSDCRMPVTARTLETLIRLSTAHAKCRLSLEISEDDAQSAIEIVRASIVNSGSGMATKSFFKAPQKKGDKDGSDDEDDDNDDQKGDGSAEYRPSSLKQPGPRSPSSRKRTRVAASQDEQTPAEDESLADEPNDQGSQREAARAPAAPKTRTLRQKKAESSSSQEPSSSSSSSRKPEAAGPSSSEAEPMDTATSAADEERLRAFQNTMVKYFAKIRIQDCTLEELQQKALAKTPSGKLTAEEIDGFLKRLQDDDLIMYRDGRIYLTS
mmetsp:Transcript_44040/g.71698  ORF Transcript_44040/g.71698 Transcript_44040/m.71698 type:complete len:863 (+) Transcript_44040:134-2722(+)|eukprot:CAMPEP_0184660136 /NCGR_PEP_ID=MMETSP0308-20130426/32572_1 /TAXON_ID=38269 /ORGANISM="Gloeochaete witrockiana, Strain SAG 46.84" /LENGTH=862 /DNA_ID=CAMNT_0027100499 /DNA_START=69 /DNA_END=2657 /DNA_ORIENTATION=+